MDQRRSGHGIELGAHGPRTMGEAAKGPAGVAGFLKEKNQNELLRGRLAPDIPTPPGQTSVWNRNSFQGPARGGAESGREVDRNPG